MAAAANIEHIEHLPPVIIVFGEAFAPSLSEENFAALIGASRLGSSSPRRPLVDGRGVTQLRDVIRP